MNLCHCRNCRFMIRIFFLWTYVGANIADLWFASSYYEPMSVPTLPDYDSHLLIMNLCRCRHCRFMISMYLLWTSVGADIVDLWLACTYYEPMSVPTLPIYDSHLLIMNLCRCRNCRFMITMYLLWTYVGAEIVDLWLACTYYEPMSVPTLSIYD
jgi:hypothetical protein